MATVTGLTAERMEAIEAASVVDGNVVVNDLILVRHDGTTINAGSVRGPMGPSGSAYTICTSTTRPGGLGSTEEGLAIFETDTGLIRTWTGTRWKLQERIVCTSTTRPSGLVAADEGVEIYQTDNNKTLIWDGSAWIQDTGISPIFEVIRTADSTTVPATSDHEFTGYSFDISPVAGRGYYVKFGYQVEPSINTGIRVQFTVWDGAAGWSGPVTAGTKRAHADLRVVDTTWVTAEMPMILPTGGTRTLRFSAICLTGGQSCVVQGDPLWPGFYQILEGK